MSQHKVRTVAISEIEVASGINLETLRIFIQREWITPYSADSLDDEDIARIRLIREIQENFRANDEALDLILHLMDQVYSLRARLAKTQNRPSD